jgi:hypothetical protein
MQYNSHENMNDILHRNRKNNSKIYMEAKKSQISKAILSTVSSVRDSTILHFEFYFRIIVTKSVILTYRQTCRPIE